MRFRYKGTHLTVLYNSRTVIKLAVCSHRHAHSHKHIAVSGSLCYLYNAFHCLVKQSVLKEQVLTGIACHTKLREHSDLYALFPALFKLTDYFIHIEVNVCHLYLRGAGGDLYKTVFHKNKLLTRNYHCYHYTIFYRYKSMIFTV